MHSPTPFVIVIILPMQSPRVTIEALLGFAFTTLKNLLKMVIPF
jgi:hypothetical protein